jgi:hypothetical protein
MARYEKEINLAVYCQEAEKEAILQATGETCWPLELDIEDFFECCEESIKESYGLVRQTKELAACTEAKIASMKEQPVSLLFRSES